MKYGSQKQDLCRRKVFSYQTRLVLEHMFNGNGKYEICIPSARMLAEMKPKDVLSLLRRLAHGASQRGEMIYPDYLIINKISCGFISIHRYLNLKPPFDSCGRFCVVVCASY